MTQEMLSRLGCSPRFNTPGHPEASGLVERFNQTCKNMLYHVIQQHGRQWHKILPLMTWAIREVPNATTGVSPYMLMYGRAPRGPLAVLKESWTGERDVSIHLNKPVDDYLVDPSWMLSRTLPRHTPIELSRTTLTVTTCVLGTNTSRKVTLLLF